jgi:hypothetical protein
MTDSTNGLLDKFTSVGDFSKLQIHVIFNYMPFTDKTKEPESPDSSSFTDEFIKERIKDNTNQFNFSITDNSEFILEKNISKTELESLLPELNSVIENNKQILKSSGIDSKITFTKNDTKLSTEQQELMKAYNAGTRITKRQKKTPPKRSKHHTARKHT